MYTTLDHVENSAMNQFTAPAHKVAEVDVDTHVVDKFRFELRNGSFGQNMSVLCLLI